MVDMSNEPKTPIAVPIIFVPGIMGSRLCNEDGDVVWDPPGGASLKAIYQAIQAAFDGPQDRKERLIGDTGSGHNDDFLHVAGLDTSASKAEDELHWELFIAEPESPKQVQVKPVPNQSLAVTLSKAKQPHRSRGWGGVHWESYGDFLKYLENEGNKITQTTGNCHVYLPVYACGYNWTNSNAHSAQTLAGWIDYAKQEMSELGIAVDKVLVISHSMGGFVSRYYSEVNEGRGNIHGICHIAMPDNGSPATYKRMKAGFEGGGIKGYVTKLILGKDGPEVTAVLAHAPGGLELLPNKHYRKNCGKQGSWITFEDNGKSDPLFEGDPYESPDPKDPNKKVLYKERTAWWRLFHPEWIEPDKNISKKYRNKMLRDLIIEGTLNEAKKFHEELGEQKHANTWLIYSAYTKHKNKPWQYIQWKGYRRTIESLNEPDISDMPHDIMQYPSGQDAQVMQTDKKYTEVGDGTIELNKQSISDWDTTTTTIYGVQIQPGDAPGDGTVHAGSNRYATVSNDKNNKKISLDIEEDHQMMMNNEEVREHVLQFIETMLQDFAGCNFNTDC